MRKRLLGLNFLLLVSYYCFSQSVGIGTAAPDVSAALDITATNRGLLIPRMNNASINTIANPARGLLVYDSVANQLMVNIGTPLIPNWQPITGNNNIIGAWSVTGNDNINASNNFIGTTNNQPLRFRVNNIQAGELHPNTGDIFWGIRAGQANTTGFSNIAIGTDALRLNINRTNLVAIGDSALFNNSDGSFNSAIGSKALHSNTSGSNNTATGFQSLFSNTIGQQNTAIGNTSLRLNTIGSFNTAAGSVSLFSNTTGNENTALGYNSLASNVNGSGNTAVGVSSLVVNGTGDENTAIGSLSLVSNATGNSNTATGSQSLAINFSGNFNTAVGVQSLFSNSTGDFNTAIGGNALNATFSASRNTTVGFNAGFIFNLGSDNTLIGANADANQDGITNATAIGAGARVNASNKVRIGNSAVTVIEGQVPFTTPSDGRFKFNIKEDVKGLGFIINLRPVTYQFDVNRFDEHGKQGRKNKSAVAFDEIMQVSYNEASAIRRTGFIAQDVEKAANASGYDFSGIIKPKTEQDHYSLSYESFVVPLVKAIQEQQQILDELKKQNEELKRITAGQKNLNDDLLKRIEKLESSFKVK